MTPVNFKRKWIKLWIDECLTGTIREDVTPEERSVWYDFLLVAGRNRPPGCISANENTPLSPKRLASILNIPVGLLTRATDKFRESGRIYIDQEGVIHIQNWDKYQFTDYDRQKPYRQKPDYTLEMFGQDYDALDNHLKTGGLGDNQATTQYFGDKYGQSKGDTKGPRFCRLFMEAFNAIEANDESDPKNPSDEDVVKAILGES